MLIGLYSFVTTSGTPPAHVKYVIEGGESINAIRFPSEALSEPVNALVLAESAIAIIAVVAVYLRYRPAGCDIRVLQDALSQYEDLLPWLLRLSIGLPFVGAGFAGYFFSPIMPTSTRLFEVAVDFFLLFGLATRFVAGVGFLGYLIGLVSYPELLLAAEYVPGFIAIILLGGGRPSADQVLARIAATDETLYSGIDPIYQRLSVPFTRVVEPYMSYVLTVL